MNSSFSSPENPSSSGLIRTPRAAAPTNHSQHKLLAASPASVADENQPEFPFVYDYESGHSMWTEILNNGVSKIPAPLPKTVWRRLYELFDAFSNSLAEQPDALKSYNSEAKAWQMESGLAKYYGGYFSPYFRDTSSQKGKDNKRIVQICEPYYRFLTERRSRLLDNELYFELLEAMMSALFSSCAGFLPFISALKGIDSSLFELLSPSEMLPPVSIRLLSYDTDFQMATNPHLDKSAITVIADNDDPDGEARLIVGSPKMDGRSNLSSYRSVPTNAGESIIFLGAALREAGMTKYLPLPHAVLPFEGKMRHSAIFFWHLPNVEMQNFDTKLEVEDDLKLTRQMTPKTLAA